MLSALIYVFNDVGLKKIPFKIPLKDLGNKSVCDKEEGDGGWDEPLFEKY